jgi:ribosomal protein L37AE/L43A
MKKETLTDILFKVAELEMSVEIAEKKIMRLIKKKICPQCGREFQQTEVESGIFCCRACEFGY